MPELMALEIAAGLILIPLMGGLLFLAIYWMFRGSPWLFCTLVFVGLILVASYL